MSAHVGPEPNPLVSGLKPGALPDGRSGRDGRLLLPQHTGGCARLRSAPTPKSPGTHAMITDAAVETATAVLEERGWERDEEMVRDVRAALEAVRPSSSPPRPRSGAASPASVRDGRPRASVRRVGGTSRPRPAPTDGRGFQEGSKGRDRASPPALADRGNVPEKGPGPRARPIGQGG